MLRVMLINPPTRDGSVYLRAGRCQVRVRKGVVCWPPAELMEIAAVIRRDVASCAVSILDAPAEQLDFQSASGRVTALRPHLLIIQATTPTLDDDLAFAGAIKSNIPSCRVITIGVHGTSRPGDVLTGEAVDLAVKGEPHLTCSEIARAIEQGAPLDPAAIPGTVGRAAAGLLHGPERAYVPDLDSFPPPAFDLIDHRRYRLPIVGKPFAAIIVSRGCPYRCTFCTVHSYHGQKWRARSPDSIATMISGVQAKMGLKHFLFQADTFNMDRSWVLELCEMLTSRCPGIRFVCNLRIDLVDDALVSSLARAGCVLTSLGLESGSQSILNGSLKQLNMGAVANKLQILKRHRIVTLGYFMMGLPGEDSASMAQTAAYARRIGVDFAQFWKTTPLPGSPLYLEAEKKGWLSSRAWRDYGHGDSNALSYGLLSAREITRGTNRAKILFHLSPSRLVHGVRAYWRLRRDIGPKPPNAGRFDSGPVRTITKLA